MELLDILRRYHTLLWHPLAGKNQTRRFRKFGMSVDRGQGDEWGITGVQKVHVDFDEDWAEGFTTDVEDGRLIKILTLEHSIEPPDHIDSSGSIKAKRTPNGWTVEVKWLYDRGNKEETRHLEVHDVSVQVLD
jgi:hypothetical protein